MGKIRMGTNQGLWDRREEFQHYHSAEGYVTHTKDGKTTEEYPAKNYYEWMVVFGNTGKEVPRQSKRAAHSLAARTAKVGILAAVYERVGKGDAFEKVAEYLPRESGLKEYKEEMEEQHARLPGVKNCHPDRSTHEAENMEARWAQAKRGMAKVVIRKQSRPAVMA